MFGNVIEGSRSTGRINSILVNEVFERSRISIWGQLSDEELSTLWSCILCREKAPSTKIITLQTNTIDFFIFNKRWDTWPCLSLHKSLLHYTITFYSIVYDSYLQIRCDLVTLLSVNMSALWAPLKRANFKSPKPICDIPETVGKEQETQDTLTFSNPPDDGENILVNEGTHKS